jgi:hypothetical protein
MTAYYALNAAIASVAQSAHDSPSVYLALERLKRWLKASANFNVIVH